MKEGYVIRDQLLSYFIKAAVVNGLMFFFRKDYRDCIIDCLDFCIKKIGMTLFGYVIMSNHIHLIIQSEAAKLYKLLRVFKKFTANKILEKIQTE